MRLDCTEQSGRCKNCSSVSGTSAASGAISQWTSASLTATGYEWAVTVWPVSAAYQEPSPLGLYLGHCDRAMPIGQAGDVAGSTSLLSGLNLGRWLGAPPVYGRPPWIRCRNPATSLRPSAPSRAGASGWCSPDSYRPPTVARSRRGRASGLTERARAGTWRRAGAHAEGEQPRVRGLLNPAPVRHFRASHSNVDGPNADYPPPVFSLSWKKPHRNCLDTEISNSMCGIVSAVGLTTTSVQPKRSKCDWRLDGTNRYSIRLFPDSSMADIMARSL